MLCHNFDKWWKLVLINKMLRYLHLSGILSEINQYFSFACEFNWVKYVCRMPVNCPAIKGVSIAERAQAGAITLNWGNVPVPARRSEVWCGFCRQVESILSFTSVAVQCFWWTSHLSPHLVFSWKQGTVCKNRDKCASRSLSEGWAYNLYCPC